MAKKNILLLLAFAISVSCEDKVQTDRLIINNAVLDSAGILSMDVGFQLKEKKILYSWRGYIYPLLNYGLFVDVKSDNGDSLIFERVNKVMPKLPHPLDTVNTNGHIYPKKLKIKISDIQGKSYKGCVKFSLKYDTSNIKSKKSVLTVFAVKSDEVTVCSK